MKLIYTNKHRRDDTFRELIQMWEESGYITTVEGDDPFVWVESVNNVLLYDHPRIDDRPIPNFKHALFGNTVPQCDTCHSWIFWSRRPRLLEKTITSGIPSYSDRNTFSIFLGKVENQVQMNARTSVDWSNVIELFSMPILIGDTQTYPYTQEEYLEKVKHSKFGLVLPGYGPKCNREIEYLGLGTVPVFTPGANIDYNEPLVKDKHFLYARSTEEFEYITNNIGEDRWNEMSKNCREWYERNCSRKGSFETTKRILEKL